VIAQTVAEIWPFFDFSRRRPPQSWIVNHKVKPNIKYENNVMQKADAQGAVANTMLPMQ